MKYFLRSLCLSASAVLLSATAHGQVFFPMGVWYEGGVGAARQNTLPADVKEAAPIYEKTFADMEAHGVNVFVIPNSPPDHHQVVLDTAEKHHLKVVLELGLDGGPFGHMIRGDMKMTDEAIGAELAKVVGPIKDHPALLRVQLIDEAQPDTYGRYAHIAEKLAAFNPRTPAFSCLVGPGPYEPFLKTTKVDLAAFDFYPFQPGVPVNDALGSARVFEGAANEGYQKAHANHAESWAVIQAHAITGGLRFPTPAELRCMTWAAIGTGNRGVFWFLYQSEYLDAPHKALMEGLIKLDYSPNEDWAEVTNLTKEIGRLAPVLADLRPDDSIPAVVIRKKSMYAMKDSKGNQYLLAINFDTTKPQTLHLSIKTDGKSVKRLPDNLPVESVRKDTALTWHEELPAGAGYLYRIE